MRQITGLAKLMLYMRIALHVAFRYVLRMPPWQYIVFLRRAAILLARFWPDKAIRTASGVKLQLYLPAYPSPAFFYTLETKLLRKPPGAATVVFSMTKACHYKCEHCYQRRDGGPDVDQQLLVDTAVKMRDAGVSLFDIEGGEPFLRPERLRALLEVLDERSEIWINTIGDKVDRAVLEEFRDKGLLGLMISVHSPVPEEHDAFCGVAGAFETACSTARLCREVGLSLVLNSVLTREQLASGELQPLMDLARDLDADFVQLIHPKPSGLWLEQGERIGFDSELVARVKEEHRLYNSAARRDYPGLSAQVFEERPEGFGCTAGAIDRFYLNASGEIQPCEFLNISFGNINEEDFATIIGRMRSFFPEPCSDWLCSTQAAAICEIMEKYDLQQTPLPWEYTRELVAKWNRGEPTQLYRQLGIYRK